MSGAGAGGAKGQIEEEAACPSQAGIRAHTDTDTDIDIDIDTARMRLLRRAERTEAAPGRAGPGWAAPEGGRSRWRRGLSVPSIHALC